MKNRIRILGVILAAALGFCVVFSGCSGEKESNNIEELAPIWVAVKSVGGDDGLFIEGQDFNFTLYFGYQVQIVEECQIATFTTKNTNSNTEEEPRVFVIDSFGDEKYYKPNKDISAPVLELSFPAPTNQPCTGALEISIACYKDEAAYQAGDDYCGTNICAVYYLAESGVGTIVSYEPDDNLWERRCNILLAEGKLTQDEYNSDMHKLQEGAWTNVYQRGISSRWTETSLNGGGDVSFIESDDGNGTVSGTFSATTDSKTVTVSYSTQLDSGWCDISPSGLYDNYKQLFYLTAETENGVETWFVLYNDGMLTLSRPVSGWCSDVNGDTIEITDSQNSGAETTYIFSNDMALLELEYD